jgi:hypothetical protein
MDIEEFQIAIPDQDIQELRSRLKHTRWPDAVGGAGWDYGTNPDYLQKLCGYWATEFDWRRQEERLNGFRHYRANVDGTRIHFIHEKSRTRSKHRMPLLLTHGYPDSFLRFERIIPMLTDPARFGRDPDDAFDVVVPSLPGFGFSDRPTQRGMTPMKVAELFAKLMPALGYERYGPGGDWGAITDARTSGPRRSDRNAPHRGLVEAYLLDRFEGFTSAEQSTSRPGSAGETPKAPTR